MRWPKASFLQGLAYFVSTELSSCPLAFIVECESTRRLPRGSPEFQMSSLPPLFRSNPQWSAPIPCPPQYSNPYSSAYWFTGMRSPRDKVASTSASLIEPLLQPPVETFLLWKLSLLTLIEPNVTEMGSKNSGSKLSEIVVEGVPPISSPWFPGPVYGREHTIY